MRSGKTFFNVGMRTPVMAWHNLVGHYSGRLAFIAGQSELLLKPVDTLAYLGMKFL